MFAQLANNCSILACQKEGEACWAGFRKKSHNY